jgi:cellobiose phosphorylase
MNRRKFLGSAAVGGSSMLASRLGATSPLTESPQSSRQSRSTAELRKSSGQDYFEFSPEGTECIIKRADTPIPWMNLLTNDVFQTWVTHRGNLECFLLDRGLNGLVNPQEISGYLYVRDHETGQYFMLNKQQADGSWQSRHGLGYTTVSASAHQLAVSVTYFVPEDENALLWLITLKNNLPRERIVDLFSSVEWSLGDQNKVMVFRGHGGGGDAFTGGSQFNLFKKVYFENGILYAEQNVWRNLGAGQKPWAYTGFIASSHTVRSFECTKSIFVGKGRTVENPAIVEQGICTNTLYWSLNEFPWGVLHNSVALPAFGEKRLAIILGMVRDKSEAAGMAEKYSDVAAAEQELIKVKTFWHDFLNKTVKVETPEKENDRTINVWSKYQWRTAMWRSLNTRLRGLGMWSYGLPCGQIGGPTEVLVQPHDLEIARESILGFLQRQYRALDLGKMGEGEPLMLFQDLGMKWPPAPTRGPFPLPHHHEMYELFSLGFYLRESGDLPFLDQKVSFLDGGEGTVFEHLKLGIEYTLRGLSERGLPRLNVGLGDWDDELTFTCRKGRGESVMFAMELCYLLREWAEIAKVSGRQEEAEAWTKNYDKVKFAINSYAWDGEWYVYAFADGEDELFPVGSAKNEEGKIRLNSQSWAVLSGVAEGDRLGQCMDSVAKYLVSDYGPVLYAPPYSKLDRRVGTESEYAPGWRNACIYLRPAGWAIIAACLANRADLAFEMYSKAALSRVCQDVERFRHEPYVYPENYVGPAHRLAGEGQYQWNLGEGANWMWHSYVYYILGIRPVLSGLLVDPKIPSDWEGFKQTRQFRGASYVIQVRNPRKVSMGVKSMRVDGRTIEGNVVAPHSDGQAHSIEVVLGA